MSKLSQGQERTGGLIKIMSCFKTWPPEGSIEKKYIYISVPFIEDKYKSVTDIVA